MIAVTADDSATRTVAVAVAECARVIALQVGRESSLLEGQGALSATGEGERFLTEQDAPRAPSTVDELTLREAREIVAAVMHQPRFWPSIAGETVLAAGAVDAIAQAALRRARGAPLAYAVRSAPFRHLSLYVDERVLIPRPETEFLIDRVLEFGGWEKGTGERAGVAIDVGTGSGAIALALASEGPFSRVIGTDLSHDALAVARLNAERCASVLRCPIAFRAGDALTPVADVAGDVELIVSNPPYIAFGELSTLPSGVRDWEPALALSCADDGMAVTHSIVGAAERLLRPGGILAFEVDARRARRVADRVRERGTYEDVQVFLDLTGRERYVLARLGRTK